MEKYTGSRLETTRLFNPSVAQMLNAVCAWCDVAAYQRHLLARVAVCGAANADRMKSGRAVAGIDGHGPHRVLCVVSAPGSAGGGSTVKFVLNDEHGFLEIIPKHGQGRTRFIIIAIIALITALIITTLITTITATTTTTISKLWIVRLIKSISTPTKSGHSYSESRTIIQTVEAPASSIIEENPATFRTVTVTGTPAVSTIAAVADNTNNNNDTPSATDSPTPHSDDNGGGGGGGGSGLKQGTIVGIAVGGSAAGVFVGLIAFMVWRRNRYKGDDDGDSGRRQSEEVQGVVDYFGTANGATSIKRDNTSASEDSRMGAFGQNKNLYRNSIGSLEDTSSDWGQVLRVVNPDVPEKQH
ncbi:hypothetical protein BBAD15_g9091 [Beauveria bassiana D1-5]|uniref:Uncharacterized protein n=1 Tax=Beauveria bassiana D1-5 TaxID=1245745 RepID=A0A0A2VCT4_BEABA|nr:hypothetical protein BBAD15_g9091 [Beauveria bassiana D1-5]